MTRSPKPTVDPPNPADSEPTFVGGRPDITHGGGDRSAEPLDVELTYVAPFPLLERPSRPSEFPTVPGAHVSVDGDVTDNPEWDPEDTSPGVSIPTLLEGRSMGQEERTLTQTAVLPPRPKGGKS